MRTRLLLLFAFAAATVLMNVASAGNIAHGVEVVVIDAGHGGKFPGAHYGGVYEKDLTLRWRSSSESSSRRGCRA